MARKSVVCECGRRNYSYTGRDRCAICDPRKVKYESAELPEIIFTKRAQLSSAEQVMADFGAFCRNLIDFREYSEPVVYLPGSPEFTELAAQYGGRR